MTEHPQDLEPTPLEPQPGFDTTPPERAEPPSEDDNSTSDSDSGPSSVEFSVDDTNNDYAKGIFMRNARELQAVFVESYKQDPSGSFRLTFERV